MNAEVISKIFFKRTNRWSLRELSTIGPIYCSIPGQVCPVDVVFRVCVLTFFRVRKKSKEEVEMEMESYNMNSTLTKLISTQLSFYVETNSVIAVHT